MPDLLPHNATELESALDEAASRLGDVPVPVRDIWDPDTCPEHILPWLAWALSIDQWNSGWTTDQKRSAIKAAILVQKVKGTIGAVRAGLQAVDLDTRVVEWHRELTPGAPYTYRLFIDASANAATLGEIREALDTIDRVKSLRSHMTEAQVSTSSIAGPIVAAAAFSGNEITVGYQFPVLGAATVWDDTADWSDFAIWGFEP